MLHGSTCERVNFVTVLESATLSDCGYETRSPNAIVFSPSVTSHDVTGITWPSSGMLSHVLEYFFKPVNFLTSVFILVTL